MKTKMTQAALVLAAFTPGSALAGTEEWWKPMSEINAGDTAWVMTAAVPHATASAASRNRSLADFMRRSSTGVGRSVRLTEFVEEAGASQGGCGPDGAGRQHTAIVRPAHSGRDSRAFLGPAAQTGRARMRRAPVQKGAAVTSTGGGRRLRPVC